MEIGTGGKWMLHSPGEESALERTSNELRMRRRGRTIRRHNLTEPVHNHRKTPKQARALSMR
jgi:hypothetical protein